MRKGEKPKEELREELKAIGRKARRQIVKDYIAFPLLSGRRSFKSTLAANFTANIVRNVWAHSIIFCGHFPDGCVDLQPGGGRGGDAGRLVRAPVDRVGQHRRRPAAFT